MARGGSLPDPTVRSRVIEACLDVVAEEGLASATIAKVAARAGVSKVTLYTRWPDRESLLIDTFAVITTGPPVVTDTESFDEQLAAIIERVSLRGDRFRRLLTEVVVLASRNTAVREYLDSFQAGWHSYLVDLVALGQREGRVPAQRDPNRTAEITMAVVTMRWLYDDPWVEAIPDLIVDLLTSDNPG